LWRRRRPAAVSILVIATAILVLAAFLVVTGNLEAMLARLELGRGAVRLLPRRCLCGRPGGRRADRARKRPGAAREYVSKEEAVKRFKRDSPTFAGAADDLEQNPFPRLSNCGCGPTAPGTPPSNAWREVLARRPGVADVRYDRRWLDACAGERAGPMDGLRLAAVLILAARSPWRAWCASACTSAGTRSRSWSWVGAPMSFIRGPFVAEGVGKAARARWCAPITWAGFLIGRARARHTWPEMRTRCRSSSSRGPQPRWLVLGGW